MLPTFLQVVFLGLSLLLASGCGKVRQNTASTDTVVVHDTTVVMDTTARGAALDTAAMPITLPLLDAFFADSTFAADLRSRLGLTGAQIDSLRSAARMATAQLNESDTGAGAHSTAAAVGIAMQRIDGIIGAEKAGGLASLLRQRWGGFAGDSTTMPPGMAQSNAPASTPGANGSGVPSDTRIVVNAPAYRMDLFENGTLVRSYTIAIGYPEFPLPAGLRVAKTIIFNPTWTPPDEPWVESSKKAKVGQTVAAGSSLNPLGIAKIPIGLPSLIHAGKAVSQLGTFGSHGCVGLTDQQMREFAVSLAHMGGASLTDSAIDAFGKSRARTQNVDLRTPIPVELRYQTIVVQNGQLHIYRDVYDRNTNTEATLQAVLASYGVSMAQLSDSERTAVMAALHSMARDARGRLDTAAADTSMAAKSKAPKGGPVTLTRSVKGKKEMVVDIAALKGKGYPVAVESGGKRIVSAR